MASGSYFEIGQLFRLAREERRVSLDQAARELHIRARYLQALEDGRFTDIPGVAYTKGYIQSYAAYLRLDKDEILRRFEQMEGILARKSFYFPEVFSREQKPSHRMAFGGLLAAFVVYVLWAMVLSPNNQHPVPVVDTVQPAIENTSVGAPMAENVACFTPQELLYPPCYKNRDENTDVFPLKRPLDTIMQLGQ